ncbi:hypothetical protein [Sphingomonas sp. AX6]|uniref:hypothetical protein n=1 Tax=Sphingomonas sp. AX6 TaxID=2653171 RepID=UPI0012EF5C72|nr:hypothetical protein [Sphingomonas sp. AX6]VXC54094.1 hypothetical protein SPHINGOAX6_20270 [Sphingomonas sp. AX6]
MKSSRFLVPLALIAALTACGSGRERLTAQGPDETIYAGPNAGLSAAGTLWNLRGMLNVAALKCGGDAPDRYNRMLKVHSRSFARAQSRLQREYRRGGGDWQVRFDQRQTQLYNHVAHPRGERAFCAAAGPVLVEIATVERGDLPRYAVRSLATLDRALGR